MSSISHLASISIGNATVVRGNGQENVDTFRVVCTCGYEGPRRTARWEAEDDLTNHYARPED